MKFQDMIGLSSYYFNFKGGKEMISYYELLGMIKDKSNPEKIKHDDDLYEFDYNLNCYHSESGKCYLSEAFDEENAFDKIIEIIEDKKLNIEDFNSVKINNEERVYCDLPPDEIKLIDKINEIIEVLNEKEKIQDNEE